MSNIRPFATDGVSETNPFAFSCSFTFYTSYKIGMIGNGVGGTAVKMLKNTVVLKRIRNLFCKNL